MREDDAGNKPVCSWASLGGGNGPRWDCAVSLTDERLAPTTAGEPADPDAYCAWGTDTPPEDLPDDLPDDWFTVKP